MFFKKKKEKVYFLFKLRHLEVCAYGLFHETFKSISEASYSASYFATQTSVDWWGKKWETQGTVLLTQTKNALGDSSVSSILNILLS